ncbi:MAG: DUF2510 domain-containing protein [Ilumatobacteraceae bacterium]|nr:DUF2510 domain-containing protein [Ilumatobacteraceae bacterium]
MNDQLEDATWFETSSGAAVLDGDGQPIGQLRPGKKYRALSVGPFEVTVEGPGGVIGHVERASVDLLEPEPPTADQAREIIKDPAPVERVAPAASPEVHPPTPVPAGWLPDPDNPEIFLRYWGGEEWTEHRSPMPPGGFVAVGATATTEAAEPTSVEKVDQGLARKSGLARTVGLLTAIWACLGILRVFALVNGWDGGYGYFDENSPWWVFTSTWSVFFGSISPGSLFLPGDSAMFSPLWIFTAAIAVVGLIVAVTPSRSSRKLLVGLLAVHVAGTWILGVNVDFFGDVIRPLAYASLLPVLFIVALIVSNRGESEVEQSAGATIDGVSSEPLSPPPSAP